MFCGTVGQDLRDCLTPLMQTSLDVKVVWTIMLFVADVCLRATLSLSERIPQKPMGGILASAGGRRPDRLCSRRMACHPARRRSSAQSLMCAAPLKFSSLACSAPAPLSVAASFPPIPASTDEPHSSSELRPRNGLSSTDRLVFAVCKIVLCGACGKSIRVRRWESVRETKS